MIHWRRLYCPYELCAEWLHSLSLRHLFLVHISACIKNLTEVSCEAHCYKLRSSQSRSEQWEKETPTPRKQRLCKILTSYNPPAKLGAEPCVVVSGQDNRSKANFTFSIINFCVFPLPSKMKQLIQRFLAFNCPSKASSSPKQHQKNWWFEIHLCPSLCPNFTLLQRY